MGLLGVSAMYRMLCPTIAALAVVLVTLPISASAQVPATQIQLTEKNVEGFIAGQKEMWALAEKMRGGDAVVLSQAKGKSRVERDAIVKKYGFRDYAEYDAVAINISMVMAAIDPQTKEYADPQTAIKKEIDDVRTDGTIPNKQKKQLLAELHEALKSAPSVQFPTNIELVRKYYDKIDVMIISANDGEPSTSVVRTISE
jgi:hypothetical protein